jgi:crossover junction endodeoxyribonuclease RusA
MIAIDLPWPNSALSPNARIHWRPKAAIAKTSRQHAIWLARAAGIRANDPDIPERLTVTAIFMPPDNRRRDLDNMLASMKPALDGISYAIGVDDSKWEIALRRGSVVKGGCVRIELESA